MSKAGQYTIEGKELGMALSQALGVISLGERADSSVITLAFSKKGLDIEAKNSVAAYRRSLPVKVSDGRNTRVSVLPEALQTYSKAHKELTLTPNSDQLEVTAKAFSAKIFYVGSDTETISDEAAPEKSENISKVAKIANVLLDTVSGIRNRTDSQPLGVIFGWGDNKLEITVGDTHHAIIADATVKTKRGNTLTTTLPIIQKIMQVGEQFAATDDELFAWSETEYLSIVNKTDNMFLADMARTAINDSKKLTKLTVDTAAFRDMVDTLTGAVEETAVFNMKIMKGKILASISTASGSAKTAIKTDGHAGKERSVAVTVHHLRDCLSAMKEKKMSIFCLNNMVAFEAKNKETKITAAMTAMG